MPEEDFSAQNQSVAHAPADCPARSSAASASPRYCDVCGATIEPDSYFCSECGALLPPAAAEDIATSAFSRRKILALRYFSIAVAGLAAAFLFSTGVKYVNDWREWREDFIVASREAAQLGLTYERVAKNPAAYGNAAVSWRLLMYGTDGYYEGDWKKPIVMQDVSSSKNSVVSGEPHLFRILARVKGRNKTGAIVIEEVR